jgi:hypothetical protein
MAGAGELGHADIWIEDGACRNIAATLAGPEAGARSFKKNERPKE